MGSIWYYYGSLLRDVARWLEKAPDGCYRSVEIGAAEALFYLQSD